ncbi:MAG TPA: protein translocase SEC61 complex subunit gamma [Blastocatellia bacterium]|nr:protein translocase SEC61 complex subunit gamma [Blastocatellia bacterium]
MDNSLYEDNSKWARFKRFVAECERVLRITKKPDRVEFFTIVKVSALGMAAVGLLGFVLQMLKTYLFQ